MKKIIFLIIACLIIGSLVAYYLWLIYLPLNPLSHEELIFSIQKGEGAKEIAINLKSQNLIRNVLSFRLYVLFKGIAYQLKAGDYLLSPAMNIPEIAEKIYKGEVVREKIVILEGWNLKDIANYLESKNLLNSDEFWQLAEKDFSDEFAFLQDKPKERNLEGYLFPDTYEINRNEKGETIFRKILSNFDKKLTSQLREEINKQKKTIFEIVTMASLIEKEGKSLEDKKLIAGILWKRLAHNVPLQVDATIAYLLGLKNLDFEEMRKIIGQNRDIDSPYNTYKYKGLPLGPIANPGLDSLISAIYPQESDYWYYFSTPDGQTKFSRTLEEHNLAISRYLSYNKNNMEKINKKIAIIVAWRDFRDEEYFVPKEILSKAGAEIKTVSTQVGEARGSEGGTTPVDLLLDDLKVNDFDAFVFVGGQGALTYLDKPATYELVKEIVRNDKVLAAICISPVILAKSGVLDGKKATVWSSSTIKEPINILKENGAIYQSDANVVIDGKIITANGPAAASDFAEAIIKVLK